MGLAEILAADRRLCVLRFLAEDRDYTLNESLIQDTLSLVGHAVSRDAVRTELAWLKEQGLVTTQQEMLGSKPLVIATLTERGADVAAGRAEVPGVKRPAPGSRAPGHHTIG